MRKQSVLVAATMVAGLGLGVAASSGGRQAAPRAPIAKPALTAAHGPDLLPNDAQNTLVKQYCAGCHSDRGKDKTAGLSLQGFDAAQIEQSPETAEKMIRKLRAGMKIGRASCREKGWERGGGGTGRRERQ